MTKKKSAKSSKLHDQLELERLKQQNLQLELQLLSQKEKLGAESLLSKQDKTSAADSRGQLLFFFFFCGKLLNDQSQEKILASLINELAPPSQEEQHQLATFPVMQQLKASGKLHTVFSAKGTLDYDKLLKLDISESVYAFLEFIQQQLPLHHKHLLQFLQLLVEKAMNYSWSSVWNFNLSINQAFAQGLLTWGQMDVIQARSNTFFSHADLRSSQNMGSKFTGPRQQRDSPRREQKDSCCTDWNYTAKCSCNITDVEYKNAHHCKVCDSDQHPMLQPWIYGEVIGSTAPRSCTVNTPAGPVRRNHTQIREAKAEPEEKLEDRLETVSLPESELTETDQPVEQEPTPQSGQEPVSTLRRSMRQRRPPSRFRDFVMN